MKIFKPFAISSFLIVITTLFPASVFSQTPEKSPPYLESLGGLKLQLASSTPSEVLHKYQTQMNYAKKHPQQNFLHAINQGTLSLMANQPAQARIFFLEAAKYVEWKNYVSIGEKLINILSADDPWNRIPLQPQEHLLYQYLISLTYLQEQRWNEALINVRSMNLILLDISRSLTNNPFLETAFFYWYSGYIYEKNNLFDDARIDYEHALKVNKNWPQIQHDLWRVSALSKNSEAEKIYAKKVFSILPPANERFNIAKKEIPHIAFIHMHELVRSFSQENQLHLSTHLRTESTSTALSKPYLVFDKNKLDEEITSKSESKFPNPAYIIHINPFSVIALTVKEFIKNLFSYDDSTFIVRSAGFLPQTIFIIPLAKQNPHSLKTNSSILNLGNETFLLQSLNGAYYIPFE